MSAAKRPVCTNRVFRSPVNPLLDKLEHVDKIDTLEGKFSDVCQHAEKFCSGEDFPDLESITSFKILCGKA